MTEIADVCMLVEGTYPYVSGGVSSWIHGLITNLPDFTFSLVHLSSAPVADRVAQYVLPANVISVHDLYLQDFAELPPGPTGRRCPRRGTPSGNCTRHWARAACATTPPSSRISPGRTRRG